MQRIVSLAVSLLMLMARAGRPSEASMNERDKAQALMVEYGKHVGKMDAAHQTFDHYNDRSFGDFGFHYFPETGILQARVYVAKVKYKGLPGDAYGCSSKRSGIE